MVKYCIDKYPMGSFKGQKSPGKFMDTLLYRNLDNLAEVIVNDMTFLGIIYSSTLEVGTGKSVLATQIGEAWAELIKKKHGKDCPFTIDNIVWKPKDLMEKSFQVPKYSMLLLDEWEDSNYWSELGMSLRQFFRKCRQLNLFMIAIIPNWFQLPISYAISRSIFAIDVRFGKGLRRGEFYFYNFKAKRILYIAGKRGHNYGVIKPTFPGRFIDGYGVDEQEYRRRKLKDMEEYDQENPIKKTKKEIETEFAQKILFNLLEFNKDLSYEDLSKIFKVSKRTICRWKNEDVDKRQETNDKHNNNTIKNKEIIVNEEELERFEEERKENNDGKKEK